MTEVFASADDVSLDGTVELLVDEDELLAPIGESWDADREHP